eukprot:2481940-Amphidinium_carterae.2
MGKMNIKLPTRTQFDGNNPQFNEWAGELKTYLTIRNVHFEDCMDNCTSSIDAVNIHDDYRAEDYVKLNNKLPAVTSEDTDEYEEHNEMTMNIRKKKDDIASFSQALNYVFAHSTKPGSEAHSIMRQSSGFEAWRHLTLHHAGGHPTSSSTNFSSSHNHANNWDSAS